ncbi:hypothetical protein [Streptomyces olivoreticuli]|uniref:hypothetical protein n=1 Tax=Streptomyces olivoreticuli TaxID=68246 RepID=UPI003CC7EB17
MGRCGSSRTRAHPSDARAKLLELTERGWAATRAADQIAQSAVAPSREALGEARCLA